MPPDVDSELDIRLGKDDDPLTDKRCERCDLMIGAGCACLSDGSAPRMARGHVPPRTIGRVEASSAIIVSPAGNAHLPGCDHLSDSEISPPKFGWVASPDPHTWSRISESEPLRATQGNTDRVAIRRCQTCDARS